MGRTKKTALTIDQSYKIELAYLIKNNILIKGRINTGVISWGAESIFIEAAFTKSKKYVRFQYSAGNTLYNYKISIDTTPSNLGRGERLYFVCPISGNNCNILYRAYGSPIWKSFGAYEERIYYPTQIASRLFRHIEARESAQKRLLTTLQTRRRSIAYNGTPTKRANRIIQLSSKAALHEMKLLNTAFTRFGA